MSSTPKEPEKVVNGEEGKEKSAVEETIVPEPAATPEDGKSAQHLSLPLSFEACLAGIFPAR